MRRLVEQMLAYLGQRIWPPGPPPPDLNPHAHEQRMEAIRLENEVRAELVRAQTDALRLRALQARD